MFEFISFYHWGLAQAYCLILLCIPWTWYIWSKNKHQSWPSILPSLRIRYPLLNEIQTVNSSNKLNKMAKIGDKKDNLLFSFAVSLMILALAQPIAYKPITYNKNNDSKMVQNKEEKSGDLILVVGTPITMSLVDYKVDDKLVDRMAFARHSLKNLVKQYSGTQIGLVILGNPPALWLKLTSDKRLVLNSISRLRTLLAGRLSDIGASFELVKKNFSHAQSKVVVLVSDGSLQLGHVSPQDATRELVKAGFIVYVIAIGASDPNENKNKAPGLIFDPVDLSMLKEISDLGHGQFYHALDSQAFNDLLIVIEQKHLHPVKNKDKTIPINLYPYPLILAMILLVSIFMKMDSRMIPLISKSKWGKI